VNELNYGGSLSLIVRYRAKLYCISETIENLVHIRIQTYT